MSFVESKTKQNNGLDDVFLFTLLALGPAECQHRLGAQEIFVIIDVPIDDLYSILESMES